MLRHHYGIPALNHTGHKWVRDMGLHCVFIGKGTFVSLVLKMEWNKCLHILPQPSNGQVCNYNPRWRHLKPDLSSIPFKKTWPRCRLQVPYCSEKSSFLLTLQAVTSAYEIKLRDSIWSRTHIKDQVNVRPRMELVLSLQQFFFFHSPGPDWAKPCLH